MTVDEAIQAAHFGAHSAPHDLDDMLFLQISQRETFLVLLLLLVGAQVFECLQEEMIEFHRRAAECMKVQKEHWRDDEGDEEDEFVAV